MEGLSQTKYVFHILFQFIPSENLAVKEGQVTLAYKVLESEHQLVFNLSSH